MSAIATPRGFGGLLTAVLAAYLLQVAGLVGGPAWSWGLALSGVTTGAALLLLARARAQPKERAA